jgi:hypothetical protein
MAGPAGRDLFANRLSGCVPVFRRLRNVKFPALRRARRVVDPLPLSSAIPQARGDLPHRLAYFDREEWQAVLVSARDRTRCADPPRRPCRRRRKLQPRHIWRRSSPPRHQAVILHDAAKLLDRIRTLDEPEAVATIESSHRE